LQLVLSGRLKATFERSTESFKVTGRFGFFTVKVQLRKDSTHSFTTRQGREADSEAPPHCTFPGRESELRAIRRQTRVKMRMILRLSPLQHGGNDMIFRFGVRRKFFEGEGRHYSAFAPVEFTMMNNAGDSASICSRDRNKYSLLERALVIIHWVLVIADIGYRSCYVLPF